NSSFLQECHSVSQPGKTEHNRPYNLRRRHRRCVFSVIGVSSGYITALLCPHNSVCHGCLSQPVCDNISCTWRCLPRICKNNSPCRDRRFHGTGQNNIDPDPPQRKDEQYKSRGCSCSTDEPSRTFCRLHISVPSFFIIWSGGGLLRIRFLIDHARFLLI